MTITYTDKAKTAGTQIFENGDTYTGGFKDGKKHGRGILTSLLSLIHCLLIAIKPLLNGSSGLYNSFIVAEAS